MSQRYIGFNFGEEIGIGGGVTEVPREPIQGKIEIVWIDSSPLDPGHWGFVYNYATDTIPADVGYVPIEGEGGGYGGYGGGVGGSSRGGRDGYFRDWFDPPPKYVFKMPKWGDCEPGPGPKEDCCTEDEKKAILEVARTVLDPTAGGTDAEYWRAMLGKYKNPDLLECMRKAWSEMTWITCHNYYDVEPDNSSNIDTFASYDENTKVFTINRSWLKEINSGLRLYQFIYTMIALCGATAKNGVSKIDAMIITGLKFSRSQVDALRPSVEDSRKRGVPRIVIGAYYIVDLVTGNVYIRSDYDKGIRTIWEHREDLLIR